MGEDEVTDNERLSRAVTETETDVLLSEVERGDQADTASEPEFTKPTEVLTEPDPESQALPQPAHEHSPPEDGTSPPPPELRRGPVKESRPRGAYKQRVLSPEVQIERMSGEFHLVIPSQRIPAGIDGQGTKHIVEVTVAFFEDARTASDASSFRDRSVRLTFDEDSADDVRTRELVVELGKGFFWLRVKYPSVLKKKEFYFPQPSPQIYVFEERSDVRVTKFNRHAEPEHPRPLPRGFLWLLHTGDIEVPEGLVVETDTRTFWERYHVMAS